MAGNSKPFAGKIGAKMDDIETASKRLFKADTEKESANALDALIIPVHRFSGSAASFGFPSLSETAAGLKAAADRPVFVYLREGR